MTHRIYQYGWLIFLILINTVSVRAQDALEEAPVPKDLKSGLIHLCRVAEPGNQTPFDPKCITPVLDFLASSKKSDCIYHADVGVPGASAYNEFDFHKDFISFIQFAFSSEIPAYISMPSSVRYAFWKKIEGQKQKSLPHLWKKAANLNQPVVISGVQYEMTTPNLDTGGYYGYDLSRRLILFKHKGKNVLISLSKQLDDSEVGKKGYVIGKDSNWEYFYSGEEGLSKSGLGWTNSYIYDSYSITIFYEMQTHPPMIRCGSFKWLDAGWMGMNMVKKTHIYNGQLRYETALKEIIEHPSMPEPSILADKLAAIKKQSRATLIAQYKLHLERIIKRSEQLEDAKVAKKIRKLLENGQILKQLKDEELYAVLAADYIKMVMGKIPDQKMALGLADK